MRQGRLSTRPGLHLNSYSRHSADGSDGWALDVPSNTISERSFVTLPNAPYVLTILNGSKEVFITWREESRLATIGTLSQAMMAPMVRLMA